MGPAAPAPAGMRAAGRDDLIGDRLPAGFVGATRPAVGFTADGRRTGFDGTGGTWTASRDASFLDTSGTSTLIGCAGVDVGSQVSGARRAAFEGDTPVMLDVSGNATGHFTQSVRRGRDTGWIRTAAHPRRITRLSR